MARIGERRHLVSLATVTRTADSLGGYTEAFTALSPATMWAAIEPATPADLERRVGNTVQASVSHLVTMRYHAEVTTQTRVTFGTRTLDVRGLRNVDERNIALELACEEVIS